MAQLILVLLFLILGEEAHEDENRARRTTMSKQGQVESIGRQRLNRQGDEKQPRTECAKDSGLVHDRICPTKTTHENNNDWKG
jgi:hypothetical protein